MTDPENPLRNLKNPKYLLPFVSIFLFCTTLGYVRGAAGGLIAGIVFGIILSLAGITLIHKHEEKQKEIEDSIVIPKIGLTEKKELWLRKKKLRKVRAENRIDLVVKIVWWIIFAIVGLTILYWISPIIY